MRLVAIKVRLLIVKISSSLLIKAKGRFTSQEELMMKKTLI